MADSTWKNKDATKCKSEAIPAIQLAEEDLIQLVNQPAPLEK